MSFICGFLVFIVILLGFPISIIWFIFSAVKKKRLVAPAISIILCLVSIILFTTIGIMTMEKKEINDTYTVSEEQIGNESVTEEGFPRSEPADKELDDINDLVDAESDSIEENIDIQDNIAVQNELSEEEYRKKCKELWHDDIFFGHGIDNGDLVKLDLFVEEERFFKIEALYGLPITELIDNYDLQRTFFYCGVQRKEEFSYIGGQINLFFSNLYDYSSSDIKEGDHLIIYGEIVEFSINTSDGYNYCSVIPRYIENNGQ